jgi:hypothetical protein
LAAINSNSQNITVNAKGYTPAVGQLVSPSGTSPSITFGTVRVGTVAAQDVTVQNAATNTAANDTLKGVLSVTGPGFTGNGMSVANVGAGQSNPSGTLKVGLDTTSAGKFGGSAQVAFTSQNADMSDLPLSPSSLITLSGTVNALANPVFSKTSGLGLFTSGGSGCATTVDCYTLDFGNLILGGGTSMGELSLTNLIGNPADDLLGSFDLTSLGSFASDGFGAVNLTPDAILGGLDLSFDADALGLFTGSFTFSGLSHNDFQSDLALNDITVFLRANVTQQSTVPEPATLALLLIALSALGLVQRPRKLTLR